MHGKGSGSVAFSLSNMIVADCALYILDWDNGVYEDRRSFCIYFRLPLPFIFVNTTTRLVRSAQSYLSPKKSMKENMKDIIFQLDIRDMACLELLDGMCLFSSLRKPVFLLPAQRLVLVIFSRNFCLNIGSLKVGQTNSLSLSLQRRSRCKHDQSSYLW